MTAVSPKPLPKAPTLTQFSPAKINLFLHITGKRADGYHELQTVFRLLDWGDSLRFWQRGLVSINANKTADKPQGNWLDSIVDSALIRLIGAENMTPNPTDNLIVKAAALLLDYLSEPSTPQPLPDKLSQIDIEVNKVIPMGAGLGGGSSNAAATLTALNTLWQLGLSQKQLLKVGASIGADVPIFILHQDAIGEGIGERLTPIDLPRQRYLLLMPAAHISTAQLFAHPELCRNCPPLTLSRITQDQSDYLYRQQSPYHNVFEPVVRALSPAVDTAIEYLQQLATNLATLADPPRQEVTARMTGSGSSVFLPLPNSLFLTGNTENSGSTDSTNNAILAINQTNIPINDQLEQWINNAPCPAVIVDSLYGSE